jgi:glutamate-1-semialdehyde aminotransferase
MGHLTLRKALASDQLDTFVREQQDDGAELVTGSELERALALLIVAHSSRKDGSAVKQHCAATEAAIRAPYALTERDSNPFGRVA